MCVNIKLSHPTARRYCRSFCFWRQSVLTECAVSSSWHLLVFAFELRQLLWHFTDSTCTSVVSQPDVEPLVDVLQLTVELAATHCSDTLLALCTSSHCFTTSVRLPTYGFKTSWAFCIRRLCSLLISSTVCGGFTRLSPADSSSDITVTSRVGRLSVSFNLGRFARESYVWAPSSLRTADFVG